VNTPKDAAAIILLKDDKVLLAQRNPNLKFLGGWHAFAGGKLEKSDAEIAVKNCEDIDLQQFMVCAVRELFEEIGVLIVRNGDKLTKGQRASLHDDLVSGRSTFKEILDSWNLWIDAEDFSYTGFWTTPNFSPVRFKTRFFVANCPDKQTPYEAISEMQNIEFVSPKEALDCWEKSEILISPPVLISLQELSRSLVFSPLSFVKNLLEKSQVCDGNIDYVELNSRVIVFPLKTPTLPPATHTNCFIVGSKEFIVIDAASIDENEQVKLHKLVAELIENAGVCKEIIVSHLHNDHHGGEVALQQYLSEKYCINVPISTHKITAESLSHIKFDKFIEDGEVYDLKDNCDEIFQLKTLHTRGHARGLLAFYDEEFGFLLSTDNVVGTGSVVIASPEGNMSEYFETLNRLKSLPNLRFLCGSHGSAIYDAKQKIGEYIHHRQQREHQILQVFTSGLTTPEEIVAKVYEGLNVKLIPLAIKTVEAYLEKLKAESRI
jgi:endoribonuclease LACTB2